MEADGGTEENQRQNTVNSKENEGGKESSSPKVPKKFVNNWRQACDRTKDRTKELLKKWRTVPEGGQEDANVNPQSNCAGSGNSTNWSEHVWNTWVKRTSSREEEEASNYQLTEIQKKKLSHFFISYLDLDRDDFISLADFDGFTERIRHFADWPKNSTEYHRLREVLGGFIQTFMLAADQEEDVYSYDTLEKKLKMEQMSLEQYLERWRILLSKAEGFHNLPLWLQYFPKILFQAINKTGTGKITKEELTDFLSSLLSLTTVQISIFVEEAFAALTSNNNHSLTFSVYRLSFANFLFARHPNGPGQFIFGPMCGIEKVNFAVDYKYLNCAPQEIEQYSPKMKSNRTSIIV